TATSNITTTVYRLPLPAGLILTADAPQSTTAPDVTFTIGYANTASTSATSAVLTDALPFGATFVAATGGGTFAGGRVTWNLGTVPAGASGSVAVMLRLPGVGIYTNQGVATYNQGGAKTA